MTVFWDVAACSLVEFEVFMAVSTKMAVFWDVAACRLVESEVFTAASTKMTVFWGVAACSLVEFEVFTAVSTKMAVFWVAAPCSLIEVYQRFRALMMEAPSSSETLVNSYQTTQRYNPEDSDLHSLVEIDRRFRGAYCAPMMVTVSASEMSVNFCQTTRRNIPEDSHLHTRRREKLRSHHCHITVVPWTVKIKYPKEWGGGGGFVRVL
jgi:hypothetical protein